MGARRLGQRIFGADRDRQPVRSTRRTAPARPRGRGRDRWRRRARSAARLRSRAGSPAPRRRSARSARPAGRSSRRRRTGAAAASVRVKVSPPIPSTASCTPLPSATRRTVVDPSGSPCRKTASAPAARAIPALAGEPTVPTTLRSRRRAQRVTSWPTPPAAAWTSTQSPGSRIATRCSKQMGGEAARHRARRRAQRRSLSGRRTSRDAGRTRSAA